MYISFINTVRDNQLGCVCVKVLIIKAEINSLMCNNNTSR